MKKVLIKAIATLGIIIIGGTPINIKACNNEDNINGTQLFIYKCQAKQMITNRNYMVYIPINNTDKKDRIYHYNPNCDKIGDGALYIPLKSAISRGFKPCPKCVC